MVLKKKSRGKVAKAVKTAKKVAAVVSRSKSPAPKGTKSKSTASEHEKRGYLFPLALLSPSTGSAAQALDKLFRAGAKNMAYAPRMGIASNVRALLGDNASARVLVFKDEYAALTVLAVFSDEDGTQHTQYDSLREGDRFKASDVPVDFLARAKAIRAANPKAFKDLPAIRNIESIVDRMTAKD